MLVMGIAWAAVLSVHRGRPADPHAEASDASADFAWPDSRIDINAAQRAQLALLPGVGGRLADRIVQARADRGRFFAVEDLARVPGIGQRTLQRLRPYAVASPLQTAGRVLPAGSGSVAPGESNPAYD